MRLKERVAIVTGGANGIGRAIALIFAQEGATVVVADRDADAGQGCVEAIEQAGGRALFAATDVSSDVDVTRLIEIAMTHFANIDILVNSAGVALSGSVVDTDPGRWQRLLDVNLSSVYRTCRATIPYMIESGGGAIVNIASLQGLYGWADWAGYAASKAGIIGLTRQIAVEYADDSIRANAVSPGGIVTDLGGNTTRLEPRFSDRADQQTPAAPPTTPPPSRPRLREIGRPEDVAYATLFLASDEAAYISGQNLSVDGIASSRLD
jgi:3-oxoacyl-[acyl-carrier protein] reductase